MPPNVQAAMLRTVLADGRYERDVKDGSVGWRWVPCLAARFWESADHEALTDEDMLEGAAAFREAQNG